MERRHHFLQGSPKIYSKTTKPPIALSIAGSDSGGGAGIQADLRTFAFHQVHGTSAITCVTAQNTTAVTRVDPLSGVAVVAQMEAVTSDMDVSAAKTGMLLNVDIINAVSQTLANAPKKHLVVDPVMVSRSGDQLIEDSAVEAMKSQLLPLANVLTPNKYEAEILAGMNIASLDDMCRAAKIIFSATGSVVLIKGGALPDGLRGVDLFFDGQQSEVLKTEFVDTPNTHGTGCTLSAAITANLALNLDLLEACIQAKRYVTEALKHSLSIGKGKGPVGHGFRLRSCRV